jgi:prophage regulatory protein
MQKDRLLRLSQIIPDILPVSKSHFWQGVKDGRYPQPIKLSKWITAWRESDILALINKREDISG